MGREVEMLEMDDDQAAALDLSALSWTERAALQLRHRAQSAPSPSTAEGWAQAAAAQAARHQSDYEARNRRHYAAMVEARRADEVRAVEEAEARRVDAAERARQADPYQMFLETERQREGRRRRRRAR